MTTSQVWDGIALPGRETASLRRAGFVSSREVLLCHPPSLQRRLKLDPSALVKTVARARVPAISSVTDLIQTRTSPGSGTGDEGLDRLLGGSGIRFGSLTEIVGHAAAGKSNLCLQLALTVQCGTDAGGAIILSSETSDSAFPSTRLEQLADAIGARHGKTSRELLDNVHLNTAADFEVLEHITRFGIPALVESIQSPQLPIRLVIIDSLAAPMRAEYDGQAFAQRAQDMATLVSSLKETAHRHRLAIVIVNQVTDVFNASAMNGFNARPLLLEDCGSFYAHDPSTRQLPPEPIAEHQTVLFSGQSARLHKRAALGLSWANLVDTRLMLSAQSSNGDVERRRTATIVFSPFAPSASIDYLVRSDGIVTVSDVYDVGKRGSRTPAAPATSAWWREDEPVKETVPTLPESEMEEWDPDETELRFLDQLEREATQTFVPT